MSYSRRHLLGALAAAAALTPSLAFAASRMQQPTQPRPTPPRPPVLPEGGRNHTPRVDPKLKLEENQKSIQKDVQTLFDLATDLKKEVEKTDSSEVLSLHLVKKAQEIEKLAKRIQSRARG